VPIGAQKDSAKESKPGVINSSSGRARQTRTFGFVIFNQLQNTGLKSILRAINGSDRLTECLLLELFLNCQAEFKRRIL